MIALRAALVAALWLAPVLSPARAGASEAAAARPAAAQSKTALRFSKHALARMNGRGVTQPQVLSVVATQEPFQYYYEGRWKTGYYDPKSRVFVATNEGVVITVIADVTPRYIAGLKRKRP